MHVDTEGRERELLIQAVAGHFGEGDTSRILTGDQRDEGGMLRKSKWL